MAVGGFERAMGASKSFAILTGLLLAGCMPGDYQIVNFDVFQNGGMVQSN